MRRTGRYSQTIPCSSSLPSSGAWHSWHSGWAWSTSARSPTTPCALRSGSLSRCPSSSVPARRGGSAPRRPCCRGQRRLSSLPRRSHRGRRPVPRRIPAAGRHRLHLRGQGRLHHRACTSCSSPGRAPVGPAHRLERVDRRPSLRGGALPSQRDGCVHHGARRPAGAHRRVLLDGPRADRGLAFAARGPPPALLRAVCRLRGCQCRRGAADGDGEHCRHPFRRASHPLRRHPLGRRGITCRWWRSGARPPRTPPSS